MCHGPRYHIMGQPGIFIFLEIGLGRCAEIASKKFSFKRRAVRDLAEEKTEPPGASCFWNETGPPSRLALILHVFISMKSEQFTPGWTARQRAVLHVMLYVTCFGIHTDSIMISRFAGSL